MEPLLFAAATFFFLSDDKKRSKPKPEQKKWSTISSEIIEKHFDKYNNLTK